MSGSAAIENQGIVESLELPAGFSLARKGSTHNYLEFQTRGSCALICYEQTDQEFIPEDISKIEKVLDEDIAPGKGRVLNLSGAPSKGPDDSGVFDVLALCFVFGGGLTRNGDVPDMDKCAWEVRNLTSEKDSLPVIVGKMRFLDASGRRSKREVTVVLPQAPSPSGCGYLFLEGDSSDIRRFEKKFLESVSKGTYRSLATLSS